jgi:hypothetical protein
MPLCFPHEIITARDTFEHGLNCPTRSRTTAASGGDVLIVALLGLLGGALAASVSIPNLEGTRTPYDVPVALALLKGGGKTIVAPERRRCRDTRRGRRRRRRHGRCRDTTRDPPAPRGRRGRPGRPIQGFGHAVFAVEGGKVWSNDILPHGQIDRVGLGHRRPRWGLAYRGWIDTCPAGPLPETVRRLGLVWVDS